MSASSPESVAQTLQSLSAFTDRARALVARCLGEAADPPPLAGEELKAALRQLDEVVRAIAGDVGRVAAAVRRNEGRHVPGDVTDADGGASPSVHARRQGFRGTDMPRLTDFLQGVYQESPEPGIGGDGEVIESLPQVAEIVQPLYDAFFCPLTRKVMLDPVTVATGVSYERAAIEEHLSKHDESGAGPPVCPVTREALQSTEVIPNQALKSVISEWVVRNEAIRVRVARTSLALAANDAVVKESLDELTGLARLRGENRELMHRIGVTKLAAQLVGSKDPQSRCKALELLCLLAEDDQGKEIIRQTRAIHRSVRLLSKSHGQAEKHGVMSLLLELSKSELLAAIIGATAGCILMLTTMRIHKDGDPVAADKAGQILKNLEVCPANIKYMAENNYFDPLQHYLVEGSEEMQMEMVSYLGDLVAKQEMTINIAGNASEILMKMVGHGTAAIRKAAFDALVQISAQRANSRTLVAAGAVAAMVEELFIRKADEEPVRGRADVLKVEAAAVLANILEFAADDGELDPETIPVNKEGHNIGSHYSIFNFVHKLKPAMPEELNLNILRVLLSLTRLDKQRAAIITVMKDDSVLHSVIELLNSGADELVVAAARLLIILATDLGLTIAERLCRTQGQPGRLVKSTRQGRVTEKCAVAVTLLAQLPLQHQMLNLALLHQEVLPVVVSRIDEIQRGEIRKNKHTKPYIEGLVGVLVRFTATLYDGMVMQAVADINLTAVLTDLLLRPVGSEEVQRLAASGLENLSSETVRLLQAPTADSKRASVGGGHGLKKNLWTMMTTSMKNGGKSSGQDRHRTCLVHRGPCTPAYTFCLVEAGAVEGLIGCLESDNAAVVEAALGALRTLLTDQVDWAQGTSVLVEGDAVRYVLGVMKEHKEGSLWHKCLWMIYRFLLAGSEQAEREIVADRFLPTALVTAYLKGDAETQAVAEEILRRLNRMPDQSTAFVSMEF